MRQVEFKATIPEDELKRWRRARPSSGWVAAGLVLAAGWVFAGVSLSPSALEFSSLAVGTTADEQVKITNRSVHDFWPASIGVEGSAAKDFHVNHRQCEVVPAGQTCVLSVQFRPQEPGAKQAELVARASDGKEMATELSGTARPAAVSVFPGELDFGQVQIGSSSNAMDVVLQGEGWFHVHGLSVSGSSDQYKASTAKCNDHAGGLRTCVISVRFTPRGEGDQTAELVIADDAVGSPHQVNLRGTAVASVPAIGQVVPPVNQAQSPAPASPVTPPPQLIPAIRVDPLVLDFSSGRHQQMVSVFNSGTGSLQIQVKLQGPDPERFTADEQGCNGQIQPGSRCSVAVKFNPKRWKPKRSYNAQLDIAHNAPNMTMQSVALRWERIESPQPHVTVTPSSLYFSPFYQGVAMQTASLRPQLRITIRNDGPVALTQLNLWIGFLNTGTDGPFSHSNNCQQLGKEEECTETVSFTPAHKTSYSETLYICEGLQPLATVDLKATLPTPIQ